MTDFREGSNLGERLKALRRLRGMKSSRELVDAVGSPNITESIVQNIEAGRKLDLTVSQLLNLALALRVPPVFLLAPIGEFAGGLDLPNLSVSFDGMSVAEFDAWLGGLPNGAYKWTSVDEQSERVQLDAVRSLEQAIRERARLKTLVELEKLELPNSPLLQNSRRRLSETDVHIEELTVFLESAGWRPRDWT